jgi:hypothetical protein
MQEHRAEADRGAVHQHELARRLHAADAAQRLSKCHLSWCTAAASLTMSRQPAMSLSMRLPAIEPSAPAGPLRNLAHVINIAMRRSPETFLPNFDSDRFRNTVTYEGRQPARRGTLTRYSANTFVRAYFFKNLLKCLIAAEHCSLARSPSGLKLIDLGAGPGTFTLAWALTRRRADDEFLLVERDAEMIRLGKQILSWFPEINARYLRRSVDPMLLDSSPDQHRLSSYWLCEQPELTKLTKTRALRELAGAGLILVDYPDLVSRIVAHAKRAGLDTEHIRKQYTAQPEIAKIIGSLRMQVNAAYIYPN